MKTFFGLLLLAAVLGLLFWFWPTTDEWLTYQNETYDFQLTYPPDWRIWEGELVGVPVISVIPPATASSSLPLSHHSNFTQVSIFPAGVPTEGVFGETATSTVAFQPPLTQAWDYHLAAGQTWGTYANFQTPPSSWEPWGFLWGAVAVSDQETRCLGSRDQVLSATDCDLPRSPGARVVHFGQIDDASRQRVVQIMESFRFSDR